MSLLRFMDFLSPVSLMQFLDLICSLYILSLMSLSSSSRRSNKLAQQPRPLCTPKQGSLLSLHREQHTHAALHGVIEIVKYFLNKCILKVSTSFLLLCAPTGIWHHESAYRFWPREASGEDCRSRIMVGMMDFRNLHLEIFLLPSSSWITKLSGLFARAYY